MPERPCVAVAGANGFIGNRLVEWLVLRDLAVVRPLVHSFRGMARVARFDLDCRAVDATDSSALERALKGCAVLFYSVHGDRGTLVSSAEAAYRAASCAGVRRLVYLSSTVVYGNAPPFGTTEDSALIPHQPYGYNVGKVLAEQSLRRLRADGAMQLVILRPPIVFGPRSTWFSANVARDLLSGRAFLVDRGMGVCNTVYVDNLVQAMWLAATSDGAADQDFIVTDGERVTWFDLYSSVATAVGADMRRIIQISSAAIGREDSATRQRLFAYLSRLPSAVKRSLRAVLPHELVSRAAQAVAPRDIDRYLASTQCCAYVLPIDKARDVLGYRPRFSFSEGARRTGAWLRFALGLDDPRRPSVVAGCTVWDHSRRIRA